MQTVWEAGEGFLVPRTWARGWSPWEPSKEGLSDLPVSPLMLPPEPDSRLTDVFASVQRPWRGRIVDLEPSRRRYPIVSAP